MRFWGAKIDWQISDRHLLELLAFSDENERVTDTFAYSLANGQKGAYQSTSFNESGGMNWATTYTGYLTDNFTLKALYGENERDAAIASNTDLECSRVQDRRANRNSPIDLSCSRSSVGRWRAPIPVRPRGSISNGCSATTSCASAWITKRTRPITATQYRPRPAALRDLPRARDRRNRQRHRSLRPATEYVRTRNDGVAGEFETINSAYYLEDNWSVTAEPGVERGRARGGLRQQELGRATPSSRSTTWSRPASDSRGT